MTTPDIRANAVASLRARMEGRVILPADADWDASRRPWRSHVDQRPAVVVLAHSAADVVHAVRFGASHGLRVTGQSTGHNPIPLGDLSATVLIRTQHVNHVSLDQDRRVARAGSGATWGQVLERTAPAGLAGLSGMSPGVGVAGYTLGGGIGWFARSHGLASSSLRSLKIVTADGRLRTTDSGTDPDLFWALRGGGGSFGIVTELEFDVHPIAEVVAGCAMWPVERAQDITAFWRDWAPGIPESVTTVVRILRVPDTDRPPPALRGRAFVMIEVAAQLDESAARPILDPVRALGPEVDNFRTMRLPELGSVHMDPQDPMPAIGDGVIVRDLSAGQLGRLVDSVTSEGSALRSVEIRMLGGALDPTRGPDAALRGLSGRYCVFGVGDATVGGAEADVQRELTSLLEPLRPSYAVAQLPNFVEHSIDPEMLFGPELPRLRDVKTAYDPADIIHGNHRIAPW